MHKSNQFLKELQAKNFGSQLFEKAIKLVMQKRYKRLWLGVWEINHNAISVLPKKKNSKYLITMSFQLVTDFQTDLLMSLEL